MRLWISQVKGRLTRRGHTRRAEESDSQQFALSGVTPGYAEHVGLDVEAWLDQKAEELNGEWVFARLAGFSRGDEAAARQLAAAGLQPKEELQVESFPEDLYSSTAMRVLTVGGTEVGFLEPTAAEAVSRQMRDGDLIRCFVYRVTKNAENMPSSVMLALMSWACASGPRP